MTDRFTSEITDRDLNITMTFDRIYLAELLRKADRIGKVNADEQKQYSRELMPLGGYVTARRADLHNDTLGVPALFSMLAILSNRNKIPLTLNEYKAYADALKKKPNIYKNRGGMLPGTLRQDATSRTDIDMIGADLLAIDIENPEGKTLLDDSQTVFDAVAELGVTACIYSTIKHQTNKPRLRVVLPLSRTLTPEEYDRCIVYLASMLSASGVPKECIDTAALNISRNIGLPVSCQDTIPYYRTITNRPLLNADELAREAPEIPKIERNSDDYVPTGDGSQTENIKSALDCIDCSTLTYDEWFRLQCACKREGVPYDVIDEFNKTDEARYKEQENASIWEKIQLDRGNRAEASVKTVYNIASAYGFKEPVDPAVAESFNELVEKASGYKPEIEIENFLNHIQSGRYKPVSTGLDSLDILVGGGFLKQTLTVLVAEQGTGKTTFMQQYLENMAANGHNVIYICLEMSKDMLYSRSVSRLLWMQNKYNGGECYLQREIGIPNPVGALSANEILQAYNLTASELNNVRAASAEYSRTVLPRMKYNPGKDTADLDSIMQMLEAEAEAAKAKGEDAPIVCIDYLNLIETAEKRLDEQTKIKTVILRLKNYAIKHNTMVFTIAASNRTSSKANEIDAQSARDTSNIEYSADYLLGLYWDEEAYKMDEGKYFVKNLNGKPVFSKSMAASEPLRDPQYNPYRAMVLKVNKNRYYIPGREQKLRYFSKTNTFIPVNS